MPELNRQLKVVIFTAAYGGGHNAVSNAIMDAFKIYYPGQADAEIIDYMDKFAPGRDSVLRMLYVQSTLHIPWTYGLFFSWSDKLFATSIGRKIGSIGGKGVKEFLDTTKPDIVISVYPTPAQVIPKLELSHPMVNATLVTDFGVHSQWINPKAQLFLVAAPEVKEFLKTVKGIPEERIKVTGIPIRNVFTKTVDVAAARKKFNLKYDFTVLLMTNGQEIPDVEAICTKLLDLPVHIVVLCGKNEKMTEMATKLSVNTDKIIIFGMAKDMDELMRVSDVLISKAGGITVSEATACALPIVMFRPYPGQEIYNQDYLINHNAGFLANKPKDVYEQVKSICDNRERLTDMKKNSRSVGRPEAAQAVCQAVLEEYKARYKV